MEQCLAVAQCVTALEHVIVAQLLPGPPQFAHQGVYRHDGPVERPGDFLQEHDQGIAPAHVGHLVQEHISHLRVTDGPDQSVREDNDRPP
jgi:hypothetical protein